ncbi:transposase [Kocuria sp. cx-455]|uniref:transposase n=1 Tax=Kocuria sp. cx-455 TaxID=2771377 RepID=UPI00168A378A|nr:transposase [Kocuria sp. cx-455]
MGRQRREFSPEHKDEAVKLVINTGRPVAVVAGELGIGDRRWAGGSTCSRAARRLLRARYRRPSVPS